MTEILDRIAAHLVGLRMPRALEALDHTVRLIEQGELSTLEAIDRLLAEELNIRENRRIGVAMSTARLMPPKTLEGFDFSFQPSLARDRIMTLAQLDFIARAEVVHFLGPPGTGKSHLATTPSSSRSKAPAIDCEPAPISSLSIHPRTPPSRRRRCLKAAADATASMVYLCLHPFTARADLTAFLSKARWRRRMGNA